MKHPLLLTAISACLFNLAAWSHEIVNTPLADTGNISHIKDGILNEWPSERFTNDEETGIQYAIDNDAANLYIALKIQAQPEQLKMMRQGMQTYFDIKGKHKESKGVEFPLKKDYSSQAFRQASSGQGNGSGTRPDFKEIRMMYGQSLLALKLFGFGEDEAKEQSLETEESLQIGFSWNDADVMMVEYLIPLKMLDSNPSDLNQKQISVGWKVNGIDTPGSGFSNSSASPNVQTRLVGAPAGRTPSTTTLDRPRNTSNSQNSSFNMDKMMKEQSIWAKYTINITK